MGTWVAVTATMPQCLRGGRNYQRHARRLAARRALYQGAVEMGTMRLQSVSTNAWRGAPCHDLPAAYQRHGEDVSLRSHPDGELDRFAADFSPGVEQRRAVFLSIPSFLDDCEARISYADQREKLGPFVFASLVALFALWCCVLGKFFCTLCGRGAAWKLAMWRKIAMQRWRPRLKKVQSISRTQTLRCRRRKPIKI